MGQFLGPEIEFLTTIKEKRKWTCSRLCMSSIETRKVHLNINWLILKFSGAINWDNGSVSGPRNWQNISVYGPRNYIHQNQILELICYLFKPELYFRSLISSGNLVGFNELNSVSVTILSYMQVNLGIFSCACSSMCYRFPHIHIHIFTSHLQPIFPLVHMSIKLG
jgi:hypothetical protein